MITILNNTSTRVHYLRSSGLDKNIAAQVERIVRKFSQRRITMNDIYSYTGVINKVGGMAEMVLPQGRNDYKAIETDTIPAMDAPVNPDIIEQYRRQAINGMGVPNLLVINAIDEVDFAKTLEMANARFLSTISSYKIDFNKGITELYQRLMKYNTDMNEEEIREFKFKFNEVKSPELNITNEMIGNYNTLVETVSSLYYNKTDMEDENGNATPKQIILKKKLAEKYLPQLDFDELDEIIDEVNTLAVKDEMDKKAEGIDISDEEINNVENNDNTGEQ